PARSGLPPPLGAAAAGVAAPHRSRARRARHAATGARGGDGGRRLMTGAAAVPAVAGAARAADAAGIEELRRAVEELFAGPAGGAGGAAAAPADAETRGRALVARFLGALEEGRVRAAEPDPAAPCGWRVNAWVKQGILLGFRFGKVTD